MSKHAHVWRKDLTNVAIAGDLNESAESTTMVVMNIDFQWWQSLPSGVRSNFYHLTAMAARIL
jgi:hypothetical protein